METVVVTRDVQVPVGLRTPTRWFEAGAAGLMSEHDLSNGRRVQLWWLPVRQKDHKSQVVVVVTEVETNDPAPSQTSVYLYRFHAARASEQMLAAFEALPRHA